MNIGELMCDLDEAELRVRMMQTKLHQWAITDPDRCFDDLYNLDKNFRRFLWQARISHGGRGQGPRVHDLRHTMAVNNVRRWFERGENVNALLPVLQTYLGHSSIGDTAYYLHLTAESYPHITAQVQLIIGDVVPAIAEGAHHGD